MKTRNPAFVRWLPAFLGAALLPLLAGCASPGSTAVALSRSYRPDNVFGGNGQLPAGIRRVAVLPLVCDPQSTDLTVGRDTLEPVLIAELNKTKKFEVVRVPAEEMERLFGRAEWTGDEVLPANFLEELGKEYGCDAVLFCQLTEYQAYVPLAVGWRMRLVEVEGQRTLWAGDEDFDAGKPSVVAGARSYQRREEVQLGDETADWLAINSPRWFGQYSIACLLGTLPDR